MTAAAPPAESARSPARPDLDDGFGGSRQPDGSNSRHSSADAPTARPRTPAFLRADVPGEWAAGGDWTRRGLGPMAREPEAPAAPVAPAVLDGTQITGMDSAGAWVLQRRLRALTVAPTLRGWPARAAGLMAQVGVHVRVPVGAERSRTLLQPPRQSGVQQVGRRATAALAHALAFLAFVGRVAVSGVGVLRHPRRFRVRVKSRLAVSTPCPSSA